MSQSSAHSAFSSLLKSWRASRNLSQLDLAMIANVSQRHISFLESGRSQPSRDMIGRLADCLQVPLREQNRLFQSAGFHAQFNESALDAPTMAPVMDAIQRMLHHHSPYPAVVMNRQWDLLLANPAAQTLLGQVVQNLPENLKTSLNVAEISLHPDGLKAYLNNWHEVAPQFVRRLSQELQHSLDEQHRKRLQSILRWVPDFTHADYSALFQEAVSPVIALDIALGEMQLRLFSVISTFGTPQDITTDELRIELFYPSDEATKQLLLQSAKA